MDKKFGIPYTFRKARIFAAMVMIVGMFTFTSPALGATILVNSVADVVANDGQCTLREAINAAITDTASGGALNECPAGSGSDTITFDAALDGIPIVLTGTVGEDLNAGGDLDIGNGDDLLIQGNGYLYTIIDGNGADRVFHICPAGSCANTIALDGLTVRNGNAGGGGGGGIASKGKLIVQASSIGVSAFGNTASFGGGIHVAAGTTSVEGTTVAANNAGFGGGIYTSATLNVLNGAMVSGNIATTNGGGIFNSAGTVTINDSTIRKNQAANGGGIYNWEESVLNITNSTIGGVSATDANTASSNGGGIYNLWATATLDNSTVSYNSAQNGGGIYNDGSGADLTIQNGSTIGGAGVGNTAGLFGGGIFHEEGSATIDASTVSGNGAVSGAGIYNQATLEINNASVIGGVGAGNTATVEGGGIYHKSGTATIDASMISANSANWGGGVFSNATLTIQNSTTIGGAGTGNTATNQGGGIYVMAGTTTVDSSQVSGNGAVSGGGIYSTATLNIQNYSTIGGMGAGNVATTGGGIYNQTGTTTVSNSVVSKNTATNGGGIYNNSILIVQVHSVIGGIGAGNQATAYGGGINNAGGSATLNTATVSANQAASGGGIYNNAALTIQNQTVIGGAGVGNVATTSGGGIYHKNGTTNITDSIMFANTAATGGAIYNNMDATGVVYISISCIIANSVSSLHNAKSPSQSAPTNWWGAATGPNTPGADTTIGNWTVAGFLTGPVNFCGYSIFMPLTLQP